jgi:hypothetical protein
MILILVAIILLAAVAPRPIAWVALGLAVIALLLVVLGGFSVTLGR